MNGQINFLLKETRIKYLLNRYITLLMAIGGVSVLFLLGIIGFGMYEYMESRAIIAELETLSAVENVQLTRELENYYNFLEGNKKKIEEKSRRNDKALLLHIMDCTDNKILFKSIVFSETGFTIEAEVYNLDSWTQYIKQLRYVLKGVNLNEHKQENMATKTTTISLVGSFK